jgi:hypothetical protein
MSNIEADYGLSRAKLHLHRDKSPVVQGISTTCLPSKLLVVVSRHWALFS